MTIKCYICSSERFSIRPGIVRDQKDLKILECLMCGLVTLDSHCHVGPEFNENSGMHGGDLMVPRYFQWVSSTVG